MSYIDLKAAVYVLLTICGLGLLAGSFILARSEDAVNQLTSLVMLISGSGITFFGVLTYMLKDDPDVWR